MPISVLHRTTETKENMAILKLIPKLSSKSPREHKETYQATIMSKSTFAISYINIVNTLDKPEQKTPKPKGLIRITFKTQETTPQEIVLSFSQFKHKRSPLGVLKLKELAEIAEIKPKFQFLGHP